MTGCSEEKDVFCTGTQRSRPESWGLGKWTRAESLSREKGAKLGMVEAPARPLSPEEGATLKGQHPERSEETPRAEFGYIK